VRFTPAGIELASGQALPADIIVTATGLNLKLLGGMAVSVDGQAVNFGEALGYKGAMCSDVPNLAMVTGYTNASWTLKADLTCAYVCRLLRYMDRHGYQRCVPHNNDPTLPRRPWIDFSSGYVQRAIDQLPKQGARTPWRLYQNYVRDVMLLKWRPLADGVLRFSR
jgi:monooxygenase